MSIVDDLGYASAKAQSLRGPITTLMKLKAQPDQRLYVMREDIHTKNMNILRTETSRGDLYMFASGGLAGYKDLVNDGKYSIVGMIKIGYKSLFVVVKYDILCRMN
jgi:hypothetical protein